MRLFESPGRVCPKFIAGAVLGMMLIVGGGAAAQEERPEVRLSVEGGIDGWVSSTWPMKLSARIESDVLLVGELLVVKGQEMVSLEVEVPANGVRVYETSLSSPTQAGAVLVRVIPRDAEDGEPVASALFRPRVAEDEILVGVVDLPGLEQTLGEVRSAVSLDPITPVGVGDATARLESGRLHQLSYLVMDQPRVLPPATAAWVEAGGRLITTVDSLRTMDLATSPWGRFPGLDAEVHWYGVGEGEVLALETLAGLDPRVWATLLRPLPRGVSSSEPFFESGSLTRAALAGDVRTPSYPWLPAIVVGYALVVGPLNLWVLRRRRRLEWAWFTIPALGLAGVAAFWFMGATGANQFFAAHATVQVMGPDAQAHSGVVAATSRAREVSVSLDPEWEVFAGVSDQGAEDISRPTLTGGGLYRYELPSLGWLSLHAYRRESSTGLEVSLTEAGVELINNGSVPVLAWGIRAHPKVLLGDGRIDPGDSDALPWENVTLVESWFSLGDVLWGRERDFSGGRGEDWPVVVNQLENHAARSGMMETSLFIFALVEEELSGLAVDGEDAGAKGLTLTLFPVSADQMGDRGWAFPRVIWSEDPFGDGRAFDADVSEAQRWILEYRLPRTLPEPPRLVVEGLDPGFSGFRALPEPGFEDEFGSSQEWEAWDWHEGGFAPVDTRDALDPSRFVAPSGGVLVRVSTEDFGGPAPVGAFIMWGDLP